MNKKLVITLVILGVLIVGTLVANNIVGSRVAESVDKQLQAMKDDDTGLLPFEFEYESVSASPINGSVTITNFNIIAEDIDFGTFKSEAIELSMPLGEIFAIMNDKELTAVNKMSIELVSPYFSYEGVKMFEADMFELSYDGEISFFELDRAEEGLLPSTRQSVAVSTRNMGLANSDEIMDLLEEDLEDIGPFAASLREQLKEKSDLDIALSFDPEMKKFRLKEFMSRTSFATIEGEGEVNFDGEGVEDFEPVGGQFEIAYETGAYEMDDPNFGSFKYAGGDLYVKAEFEMPGDDFFEPPVVNFTVKMDMDELQFTISDDDLYDAAMQGIPLESPEISIKAFVIDIEKDGDSMDLNELKLNIKDQINLNAYMHIEGDGDIDITSGLDAGLGAKIKSAKIEISDLSEMLNEMVQDFEEGFPKPFPRKGDKIVIELSGSLEDPIIKGVTD